MGSAVAIIDTETTGRDPAEVIELAYLRVEAGRWEAAINGHVSRYQPQKPSAYGALAVHHILPHELEDKPPSAEAKLPEDIGYIIGHNVDYDWKALGQPSVKRICTLAIARALFEDDEGHSLAAMCYRLAAEKDRHELKNILRDAHGAMTDVLLLQEVLVDMLKARGQEFGSAESLWAFSEHCRVPKRMPFGKHRGELIKDLPHGYKSWCLKQPDFDPYILQAIRNSL